MIRNVLAAAAAWAIVGATPALAHHGEDKHTADAGDVRDDTSTKGDTMGTGSSAESSAPAVDQMGTGSASSMDAPRANVESGRSAAETRSGAPARTAMSETQTQSLQNGDAIYDENGVYRDGIFNDESHKPLP